MSSNRSRLLWPVATVLLVLPLGFGTGRAESGGPFATVAVFPVENLTGDVIPADAVRQFLVASFSAEGVTVLAPEMLDAFMARHRVRYGAGIDTATAALLREETGAEGVVIASVELSSTATPPKIALHTRLISITGTPPIVVWSEDAGLAGDDAPGWFDLGIVNDHDVLLEQAFDGIRTSLLSFLRTGAVTTDRGHASKFRPKSAYRALTLDSAGPYSVAVVPFFNLSQRQGAGEILALLFVRHLSRVRHFRVLDLGVARRQLLNARVVMDGGLSVTDAETVAALIEADFVLAGRVLRYYDYDGPEGIAGVEFSTVLIEKQSRKVVWSSHSYNEGQDGVRFFERGVSRTAHAMATQMVGLTTIAIAGGDR